MADEDPRVEAAKEAVNANDSGLAEEVAEAQLERVQEERDSEEDPKSALYSDIPDRLRWTEQCFLATHTAEISKLQSENYKREYYYVDTVSGHPAHFINKMYNKPGSHAFVEIEPGDVSELSPKFELFKPMYTFNEEQGQSNWEFDGEVPIVFEKMAKEDILLARNSEMPDVGSGALEGILNPDAVKTSEMAASQPGLFSYGNDNDMPAAAYGWTNFEWSFQGANPSEVRNDITATLTLEFQNFDQLAQIRQATIVDPKDSSKMKTVSYSLLDLLGYGVSAMDVMNTTETNTELVEKLTTDQYFQKRYEIKAVVGWNIPAYWNEPIDDGGSNFPWEAGAEALNNVSSELQESLGAESQGISDPATRRRKLAKSLESQEHVLFLTCIDHRFNILDIGRFTLTINYRARLEGVLTQPVVDILMTKAHRDETRDLTKRLQLARSSCDINEINKLEAEYYQQLNSIRRNDLEAFINHFVQEEKQFVSEGISSHRQDDRDPSNFTSNLSTLDEEKRSRIYTIKANQANIVAFAAGTEEIDIAGFDAPSGNDDPLDSLGQTSSTAKASEQILAAGETDIKASDPLKNLQEIAPLESGDDVSIQFIYLGDIIEFAAHKALQGDNYGGDEISALSPDQADRIKIVLGPYEFYPRTGDENREGIEPININLADVPISVRAFADFWYKNVIGKNRKTYPLLTFVRELVDQLVVQAMGSRCGIETGRPSQSRAARIRTNFLTLPSKDNRDPLKELERDAYALNGDVRIDQLNKMELSNDEKKELLGVNNALYDAGLAKAQHLEEQYHYLMVFVESLTPHNFQGNEDDDALAGIPHLKMHQGILQSISFEKTDIPGYREARMEQMMIQNQWNPYIQLTNVYNVALETVGNTMFYPGSYFYLDPLAEGTFGGSIGVPTTENSLSNIMGLGGYHMIISTTNTINAAGFKTNIRAVFDNNGTRRRNPTSPDRNKDGCE
tara:strand:- start:1941 stop:4829 length:2889 start_codon:yes stop_codon:yes gene_type:complete